MALGRGDISDVVKQALEEIGMTFATKQVMESTTISRVIQQLHDAGGTTWDPSLDVLAGLILLLMLSNQTSSIYVPGFVGNWFKNNANKTVGDLIDYLNANQRTLK